MRGLSGSRPAWLFFAPQGFRDLSAGAFGRGGPIRGTIGSSGAHLAFLLLLDVPACVLTQPTGFASTGAALRFPSFLFVRDLARAVALTRGGFLEGHLPLTLARLRPGGCGSRLR
jgi:hypothetical protein